MPFDLISPGASQSLFPCYISLARVATPKFFSCPFHPVRWAAICPFCVNEHSFSVRHFVWLFRWHCEFFFPDLSDPKIPFFLFPPFRGKKFISLLVVFGGPDTLSLLSPIFVHVSLFSSFIRGVGLLSPPSECPLCFCVGCLFVFFLRPPPPLLFCLNCGKP